MSTAAIDPAAQQRLQTASTAYNALQAQLQDAVGARSKLGAQATENEAVQAVSIYVSCFATVWWRNEM
jgi:hypothetical protein